MSLICLMALLKAESLRQHRLEGSVDRELRACVVLALFVQCLVRVGADMKNNDIARFVVGCAASKAARE